MFVHHRRSALVYTFNMVVSVVTCPCGFLTEYSKFTAIAAISSFNKCSRMYAGGGKGPFGRKCLARQDMQEACGNGKRKLYLYNDWYG